jgi:hypothetical protein
MVLACLSSRWFRALLAGFDLSKTIAGQYQILSRGAKPYLESLLPLTILNSTWPSSCLDIIVPSEDLQPSLIAAAQQLEAQYFNTDARIFHLAQNVQDLMVAATHAMRSSYTRIKLLIQLAEFHQWRRNYHTTSIDRFLKEPNQAHWQQKVVIETLRELGLLLSKLNTMVTPSSNSCYIVGANLSMQASRMWFLTIDRV